MIRKIYLHDIKYMLKSCPNYIGNEIAGAFELTRNCTNSPGSTITNILPKVRKKEHTSDHCTFSPEIFINLEFK